MVIGSECSITTKECFRYSFWLWANRSAFFSFFNFEEIFHAIRGFSGITRHTIWIIYSVVFVSIFVIKFPISFLWPKISIYEQNFDFWPKLRFLPKIAIFDQNCDFRPKLWFLTQISIFDTNFDFWPKFRFLTKIAIFDQNFDFWPKCRFLTKISIFW